MIVIGVDAHKRTHTLVALDAGTGANRGEQTVQASEDGVLGGLRFAVGLDEDRVLRTAGMSRAGLSARCWAQVSGWFACRGR